MIQLILKEPFPAAGVPGQSGLLRALKRPIQNLHLLIDVIPKHCQMERKGQIDAYGEARRGTHQRHYPIEEQGNDYHQVRISTLDVWRSNISRLPRLVLSSTRGRRELR